MKGFKDFLLRGNIVDLAVAVVIGGAFNRLVEVFTASFLTPLIGMVTGGEVGGEFTVGGQKFTYGAFISELIAFVVTAAVIYFVVVLPMKKITERRKAGVMEDDAPTQEQLLTEIRDLLASPRR
ncbi:large conductance mechanosensitive channel protein MscL [Blastococcus sp. Marseille-P5729]|uniref:large conductance mechanosensitive channel protein MscL n=1 Tax=Blastococcus sp. Marseille-P5729 TaxID=2086582 RepID=UPI000D10904D|nr:large conductance mechanosensitive channel protein MscL [Blastococcus sp. Marseille-P5729]